MPVLSNPSTVTIGLCVDENSPSSTPSSNTVYNASKALLDVEQRFAELQDSLDSSTLSTIPFEERLSVMRESIQELTTKSSEVLTTIKVSMLLVNLPSIYT